MSANDPDDFVRREIDWIGVPLRENKPLLGICLGAQMIARHLGERVYLHDNAGAEIGYYAVRPTDHGRALCESPFPETVYQWHREGFDKPRCATLLAEGDMFPVQGFQYGSATALQFHPDVTYISICRWTTRAGDRMHGNGTQPRRALSKAGSNMMRLSRAGRGNFWSAGRASAPDRTVPVSPANRCEITATS